MNIIEITEKFPQEIDAIRYFERKRFGKKNKCAYCGSEKLSKRTKDFRFKCYSCNKTSFVTVGTHLHSSNMDLRKWMFAFSIISDAKKGLSAMQLQRNLNISYPTAWAMYHKIRKLMSIENREIMLDDVTEIDSTQIGGKPRKCQIEKKGTPKHIPELDEAKEKFEDMGYEFKEGDYKKPCKVGKQKRGKGSAKRIVAGVVQRDGNVVAEVIRNTNFNELKKIIDKHVEKENSVLLMDKDTAQVKLSKIIGNIVIDHSKMYSYRGLNTNSIESFWAIIKRQIIGQHHHVSPKLLNNYVQETVFKYNNRKEDDMFITLIKNSMLDRGELN